MRLILVWGDKNEKKDIHQLAVHRVAGDPFGTTGKKSAEFRNFWDGGVRQGKTTSHRGRHLVFAGLQRLEDQFDHVFLYIVIICKSLRHDPVSG